MRSPKYETCQPKMNESFFKTIDLVLVASSSMSHWLKRKTPQKLFIFWVFYACSAIFYIISSIIIFFCRDFGKSFHTCTNRGNCQKSKLFPWPKTTLWHLPTLYVSFRGRLSIAFWDQNQWNPEPKGEKNSQGRTSTAFKWIFQKQQKDFWRSPTPQALMAVVVSLCIMNWRSPD